ncbi:hypothetical protein [Pediococcus claussenii]|uniref:glycan biosynthesis hexose transferase WsfD n=1 Tax=Pediococcus claussenii TaxID=187452 RepID=UPI000AEC08DE|nr:hypothetical protein [Pediococcus claussenii]
MVNNIKKGWLSFSEIISRYFSPASIAVLVGFFVVSYILFYGQGHGYADNGDFARLINQNGLYQLHPQRAYTEYFQNQFGIKQYYVDGIMPIFSTSNWFIQTALVLNRLFYSKIIFDIRFLGLVYLVFYLGAIYMFVRAISGGERKVRHYILGLVTVLIACDSAITMYFNSFYTYPATFILLLYAIALILLVPSLSDIKRYIAISAYFLVSILLVLNNYANAPLAIVLFIGGIGFYFLPHVQYKGLYLGVGLLLIAVAGIATTKLISPAEHNVNKYQSLSKGVLADDSNVNHKLISGEISQQFTLMKDEDYYPVDYTTLRPDSKWVKNNLLDKYDIFWLTSYYGHSLSQFGALLDDAAKNIMVVQNRSVGNYPKESHKPVGQVRYFTATSQLTQTFYPKTYAFNFMLLIALVIIYSVGMFRDFRSNRFNSTLKYFLMMGLMIGVCVFPITSIMTFGKTNLAQHMLPVSFILDMVLMIFLADNVNHTLWGGGKEDED